MRFGAYDGWARAALVGSLAAFLSFVLPVPWMSASFSPLYGEPITGLDLATAPSHFAGVPAEGALLLTALLGIVALVCSLALFLLAIDPGLRAGSIWSPKAGRVLSAAGLVAGVVAVLVVMLLVGPRFVPTLPSWGGLLGLAGFALALAAWPRAKLLDDEGYTPPPPPGAADGPR